MLISRKDGVKIRCDVILYIWEIVGNEGGWDKLLVMFWDEF